MEILIEISEGDITDIHAGAKVAYSTLSNLNRSFETTLKSIDPGLTLLTNGEYSEVVSSGEAIYYYGRLNVPNDQGALRIGMTVQTVIYVQNAENVLTLPATAIKSRGETSYVEILKNDNTVETRDVTTGVSDGLNVEIKSGVSEHDKVILAHLSSSEISDKTASVHGPRGF
jgi:macrolide-specific efflux system membrane fusion protein